MFTLFGTGSGLATANVSVNIDGKELTRVAEYKYLEVILDESLSWNAHVNYLRWLNRVMQDHEARASDLNRKLIFSFFLLLS